MTSSGHIVFRLDLLQASEIKKLVVNPRFVLQMFCFSKLFVVSSYFLVEGSFRARDLLLALIPAALPQVVKHHSNTSFDHQLFLGLQLLYDRSRWSSHCGTRIVVHSAEMSNCTCPADLHFRESQIKMIRLLRHTCVSKASLSNAHRCLEHKGLSGIRGHHVENVCNIQTATED